MTEVSPKIMNEMPTTADEDYNIIEHALMQNPRGRWFLEEYVKRNRPEDTKTLLSAIQRIEKTLETQQKPEEGNLDPIRMSILEMANAIAKTREEIKSIKPANEMDNQLTNATEELSAIVISTEDATNTILEAAEDIQEAAWVLREAGADDGPCDRIDTKTTEIYTACSFQDITGQRTNKVVQALAYIENRVNAMIEIWGLNDLTQGAPRKDDTDSRPDAHLLNGPAKLGEELEQSNIDNMLADCANLDDLDFIADSEEEKSGQNLADSLSFDQISGDEADFDLETMEFDNPLALAKDDATTTKPPEASLNPIAELVSEEGISAELEGFDEIAVEETDSAALSLGDAEAGALTPELSAEENIDLLKFDEEAFEDAANDIQPEKVTALQTPPTEMLKTDPAMRDLQDDDPFSADLAALASEIASENAEMAVPATGKSTPLAEPDQPLREEILAESPNDEDFELNMDIPAIDPQLADFAEKTLTDGPEPDLQEEDILELDDLLINDLEDLAPEQGEIKSRQTADFEQKTKQDDEAKIMNLVDRENFNEIEELQAETLTEEQKETLLG